DSAVDEERQTREFIHDAGNDQEGDGVVPWLAVTPPRTVQVFEVDVRPNLELDPDSLGGVPIVQMLIQPEANLFAAITSEPQRPRFLRTPHLDGTLYRLHLATWVEEHGLLFVSTDRPSSLKDLRSLTGADQAPLIGATPLRRLLNAAE